MKASELIGKVCTRTSPAVLENGDIDRTHMGDRILILNANDYMIAYKHYKNSFYGAGIYFLSSSFCDDKWENIEQFLEETAENSAKFTDTKQ